jgi:peroxiredoxin Q/BCP
MKLTAGQPAKLFTATDITGAPVALADYRGRRTLLSFLRSAACPLCSLRVRYLIDRYPNLQARGLAIIAVFETSPETTMKFAGTQHAPFPLIANPAHDLYRLYGSQYSLWGLISGLFVKRRKAWNEAQQLRLGGGMSDGNHTLLPADFLIGPDLIIERAYYGRDIGDHLPLSEIEHYLDAPLVARAR